MLTVHFNGDIVEHPNHKENKKRLSEVRDSHRICKYGLHENTCFDWLAEIMTARQSGRCCLCGSNKCSKTREAKKYGNKKKTFKINYSQYRKLSSAAHYLVKTSRHKVLFITLTFPPFKKKHKLTKSIFENEILNTYFSRFMENLRKHYDCKGYVAVREHGENNSFRTHYHVAISLPFIPYWKLNNIWTATIADICHFSKNAVTSKKESRYIKDVLGAVRYLCKYFSKSKGQISESRMIFISNNLGVIPVAYRQSLDKLLEDVRSVTYFKTSDWSGTYRINDPHDFLRFLAFKLYYLFDVNGCNSPGLMTERNIKPPG